MPASVSGTGCTRRSRRIVPEPRRTEATELIDTARRLWAGVFRGVLSTHSVSHPGYPFGSVVPYCLDREGLPLLLLSHLAQHSKNLAADFRCGLLLTESGAEDAQQQARLSVVADCKPVAEEQRGLVERYFRCFPQTHLYFEQLNFRFFRLCPRALYLNAGFASARWLGPERVVTSNPFDRKTESRLIGEASARQSALRRLFGGAMDDADVAVAGIDGHGMDLRRGEYLRRVAFPRSVSSTLQVTELIQTLAAA